MSVQEQGLHQKQPTDDIPSPVDNDQFSLSALLQPTMTLEQIKIIELALAKIKSKRDALLSNEHQGGGTSLSYDWTVVAKQMAKALTTTTCDLTLPTGSDGNDDGISSAFTPATRSSNSGATLITDNATKPPTDTPPASPVAATCSSSTNDDKSTSVEPITEMKDGVEWVSFVYSHHRLVRRYRIRTDLDTVQVSSLDEQFKNDNCVYPRANIPRDEYQGNRWAYETECNTLGWKLAHLNADEIAGKRGLIQRAVDSYRNRYPSMRSRRVARQEKLLKGTLRKRKQSPSSEDDADGYPPYKSPNTTYSTPTNDNNITTPCTNIPKLYPAHEKSKIRPKTLTIDDRGVKCRVRINIESIDLAIIDDAFRKNNCVFPRAMNLSSTSNLTQRRQDEAKCNEIGWKLAWLNPKHLTNKKNLLQRVLDIYRMKFLPHLAPRQVPRTAKLYTAHEMKPTPLTAEALAAHHQQQEQQAAKDGLTSNSNSSTSVRYVCKKNETQDDDDNDTIYTGTTDSLDFRDCFSPPPETTITALDDLGSFEDPIMIPMLTTDHQHPSHHHLNDFSNNTIITVPPPPPPLLGDEYFESALDVLPSPTRSLSGTLTSSCDLIDDASCHLSVDSCHTTPPHRYASFGPLSEDSFVDPLFVTPDDPQHSFHHSFPSDGTNDLYVFDTKMASSARLPTDIFAAQEMDWTPDVEDCILADLHSDVLVHQLFLA